MGNPDIASFWTVRGFNPDVHNHRGQYLTSSLWKRWKGFWGDDIWLNLEFYRMEGGLYPDTPNAIRRIQLDGKAQP